MKKNILNLDKTMRKYMLALITSMMAMAASAQGISAQQEREFYQKAYDVIKSYEQGLNNFDKKRAEFRSLFVNEDVEVCNDLMGLNNKPRLSVYKYIQELRKAEEISVVVRNIRKGDIIDGDTVWQMPLYMDKSISFLSPCNTFFDSHSFFKDDYHIITTLQLNKATGVCRISAMKADGDWPEFPTDYRVLQKKESDKRDNNLYINGKKVAFNDYDQYLLRSDDKITYNRGPVDEIDLEDDCDHKIQADYSDKSWRVRANMGFSLSDFNKVNDPSNDLKTSKTGEMSFGVDFGFTFRSTNDLKTSIFAGIGMSSNKVTLELPGSFSDSFNANGSQDEDGEAYTRHYKVWGSNGISQEMKATDITIPIYLDLEYQFTQLIAVYADLGVRLQTSSGKWKAKIDKFETWGVWENNPNYGGELTIRNYNEDGSQKVHQVELNGFGMNDDATGMDEKYVDNEGMTKSMTINGLAGAGLRLNLNKSLALDAGIQYIIGGKSWKIGDRENGGNTSVFNYSKASGDSVNLLRKSSGISHNALRVVASLIYKF